MRIDGTAPNAADIVSGLKSRNAGSEDKDDAKLKNACRDFEAMFVNNLLKAMRKTVVKSGLFGDQQEEEMFQEMMDAEVSKSISRTNSVGIADMLYRQLKADVDRQAAIHVEKRPGDKQ